MRRNSRLFDRQMTRDDDLRIRPGRTDIRVAARNSRPDGGATCRLAAKITRNLEAGR